MEELYIEEEVEGVTREKILEKLGLISADSVQYGTNVTRLTCGEGTCDDWWEEFVILVDGEEVYRSSQHQSPFKELQDWLDKGQ